MAQMLIRSPDDLKENVQREAKRIGITTNAFVIQILRDWERRNLEGNPTKESQRRGISMNDIVQELINHAMERPEKPTTTTKMQRRNEDEC